MPFRENYNKSLADHVKLQQMRKEMEKEEELSAKRRIEQEAEDIIKKEYEYMEARHRVLTVLSSKKACSRNVKTSCWGSKVTDPEK